MFKNFNLNQMLGAKFFSINHRQYIKINLLLIYCCFIIVIFYYRLLTICKIRAFLLN